MSVVAAAIQRMTSHDLNRVTDRPRVFNGKCKLLSGEEPYFVALFSDHLQQHLFANKIVIPYEQFFYTPSRRSEWKVGFDLSIGRIGTEHRFRTLHKVLYGTWCDTNWEWENDLDDNLHMATLLGNCHLYDTLRAYFVLHICYCVHDYRRMGLPSDQGWTLPPFSSLLRTVIVDLVDLSQRSDVLKGIDWRNMAHQLEPCKNKTEALKVLASYPSFAFKLDKDVGSVDAALSPSDYLKQCENKALIKLRCGDKEEPIPESVADFTTFANTVLDWGRRFWGQDRLVRPTPSEM